MPQNNGGHITSFVTMRLDLATKLSLMACIICAFDDIEPRDAVEKAATINALCDEKAENLKKQRHG